MSDLSRTVPQEQLPSEDLHPLPMPVINLGHLSLDSATRFRVVNDIFKACRDLGYFQVINHGISQSVMDCAVKAASDFFELPSEMKEEFASEDLRQPSCSRLVGALKLLTAAGTYGKRSSNFHMHCTSTLETTWKSCAKELVDEENPPKYKESSLSDFLDHLTANMDNKHRNFLESQWFAADNFPFHPTA